MIGQVSPQFFDARQESIFVARRRSDKGYYTRVLGQQRFLQALTNESRRAGKQNGVHRFRWFRLFYVA